MASSPSQAHDRPTHSQPATSTVPPQQCPECQARVIREGDEDVCSACGLVLGADPLARTLPWRSVDETTDSQRGAAIYAACRTTGLPRRLGRIARFVPVAERAVKRAYQAMAVELELAVALVAPTDWVPSLASTLDLGPRARGRAMRYARALEARADTFTGKPPSTLAAVCVHLAAAHLDRQTVATAADIHTSTIRRQRPGVRAALAAAFEDVSPPPSR